MIALITLFKVTCKLESNSIFLTIMPFLRASINHGKTLLACSDKVIKTSSLGSKICSKKPLAIMFKDSVAPLVKTTSSISALINLETSLRAFSYSTSTLYEIS